jgi:hypothetical protein
MFGDRIRRKRHRLARLLERASVPERPYIGRGPRYLVDPGIALACAPSLRSMAAALRDENVALEDSELRRIQLFISDGTGSAFFGRDAMAAMRQAVRLQHAVIGPKPDDPDRSQPLDAHDAVRNASPALTAS